MRPLRLLIFAFVIGCGSKVTPSPGVSPASGAPRTDCGAYARAAEETSRTPGAPGDEVQAQVVNACGCTHAISTTAAEAARLDAAHDAWTRAGCGPVNCDEPCPSPVPRGS